MTEQRHPHILIIGAGITGLIIAHGLDKAGIRYTIFETEEPEQWRPKEWTMGIHWALELLEGLLPPQLAARIVKDASVDASLDYEQPRNNGAYIFDGTSGEVLKDLAVPGRLVRVSRRKLRALCTESVDVHQSHTLQTVTCNDADNTVTATFTNGRSYTGTLLVGCDGPRSPTRDYLFNFEPSGQAKPMQGAVNMPLAVTYANAEIAKFVRSKAHPVWCMAIHPDVFTFMSMQDVPDPERPETWRFFIFPSWLGERNDKLNNEERIQDLKKRVANVAEPFRTAILSIPDDMHIPYTDVGYWLAEPWDTRNGRVTLGGDSAHPMPPFRGQGGNHAIQDAHNFVEAVKKIAETTDGRRELQTKLMKEYSDEIAKRGAEETLLSTKNGMMMMSYYDFKESPYMKQGLSRGGSK